MQVYNKLVRDKIPDKILRNRTPLEAVRGVKPRVRVLSPKEFKAELRRKLLEEYNELVSATTREDILTEMADLAEVLDALRRAEGIGDTELMGARAAKNSLAGAFDKCIFLETVG
ncbi:MAG TPA: nucleoside triphosphate pyrophosphohydrolase [Candidatus Paceibacterota bacterium]|nr:nucleoside triphosphate pyrophosphohydrolase [Candidatus Paceibacterota bacterium]